MVELYVSWCKGLAQSKQALDILRACPVVSGVESRDVRGELSLFNAAGLKVSVHNPIRIINLGLNDEILISALKQKVNEHMLNNIRKAQAGAVGFHSYNKELMVEDNLFRAASLPENFYDSESLEQIREQIILNLVFLENEINKNMEKDKEKKILFETHPYVNLANLKETKDKITKPQLEIMRNAGLMNKPEFIASIFNDERIRANKNIGLLFDTAHIFISLRTMIDNGDVKGDINHSIKKIIDVSKGRVYEMHIARPTKLEDNVYVDDQHALIKGEAMSNFVLNIAKKVLEKNHGMMSITLEINTSSDPENHPEPVGHAKKLVEQAELVAKELSLKVEK